MRALACSLAVAAVLVLGGAFSKPAAEAQSGGPLVHYTGALMFGNAPAPAGTTIRLVTAPTATDIRPCAETATTDRDGSFTLDVPRIADCATPENASRVSVHFFLVHGEMVGSSSPAPRINAPSGNRRLSLRGTAIPGFEPPADDAIPLVRFYGNAVFGREPAPAGTRVTLETSVRNADIRLCAEGTVGDEGRYWLDAALIEDCADRDAGASVTYTFFLDGVRAGSSSPAPPLDRGSVIGGVRRVNLAVP